MDAEIAERAVNILHWNAVAPKRSVQIKVQDGWDELAGQVDWHYQRTAAVEAQRINVRVYDCGHVTLDGFVHDWRERQAAEYAAWSALGVTGVEDRLTIS